MTSGFHQLGEVLAEPFLDPLSRTYWVGLLAFLVVAAVIAFRDRKEPAGPRSLRQALKHPSSQLDFQLFVGRQLLRALGLVPIVATGWWVATHGVLWMDANWGRVTPPEWSALSVAILYSATLFIVWDLSRFLVHWMMHRIPFLWSIHQVHHSAEVLTPMTFHRIHPVESWVYDLRGALATGLVAGGFYYVFRESISHFTLLGVPALAFILNICTGNIRHSHLWIRFPKSVEKWFLSPAQHQIHHSADPQHHGSNYGTWLAIWDRMLGSWKHADKQPTHYGIPMSERNHSDHLLSAWFGPLRGLAPVAVVAVFCGISIAQAEESEPSSNENTEESTEENSPPEPEDNTDNAPIPFEDYGEVMFVYGDSRTPRVAGSAHKVDEKTLGIFESDNIEQIISQVPGMSTRNEDGFGLRPNIGIRGANSDRSAKITLMEDGVLLAPAPYAAPAAYYFPMSTRLVGVEVFKGPSSTRHGPYTVGGAINVLTRDIGSENQFFADVSIGQRNMKKTHVYTSVLGDTTGILIEGVNLSSDGFKVLDSGGPTGFDRNELMLKSEWLVNADQRLELKLGYATEESNETYLGLSLSDYTADPYRRYSASSLGNMSWKRTQAELEWTGRIGNEIRVRSVAYHHWLNRSWTKFNRFSGGVDTHKLLQQEPGGQSAVYLAILRGEEDTLTDDQRLMIGTNYRLFHSFGWQTTAEWSKKTDAYSSSLELGLRIHGDHVRRTHTEDPYAMVDGLLESTGIPTLTVLDSVATAQAVALHLHEDLSIGKAHFFPGVRMEIIRGWRENIDATESSPAITRSSPLPGMGFLYEGTDKLDLFVGAHRGFSPVAPGQDEAIQPESSWNYEAGARLEFSSAHAELVGFYNDYTNITGQCTFSGGCSGTDIDRQFNGGEAEIYGVEMVTGADFGLTETLSLPVHVSYALTDSSFTTAFYSSFPQYGQVSAGDQLPYVARHQANLQAGIEHEKWSLTTGVAYRTHMLDSAGTDDDANIPAQLLLNAAASVSIADEWRLYGTGTNLTNDQSVTSWRPFGARPTAPLQINIGLKWTPSES